MKCIVLYKSKYGSTKTYAKWIAEELGCQAYESKEIEMEDLLSYDVIIYGGGLYAEVINGANFIIKNLDVLQDKKIIIYTTGITPMECREYYDKLVIEKNFKQGIPDNVKVFNFLGKMIMDELSLPHKAALKTLKKIMSAKENPTEMEKLLVKLCDANEDFTKQEYIQTLVDEVHNYQTEEDNNGK